MFSLGSLFAVVFILGFAAFSMYVMLSVVFNDEDNMQKVRVRASRQDTGVRHSQGGSQSFYNH